MVYKIVLGRDIKDKKKFGEKGAVFLGKQYVMMGKEKSLANAIYLDVVRPHVILVAGKRGSGKSYSLSVIAESMTQLPKEVSENIGILMIDTMGIFWTMKYPNYRDATLLEKWDLKPEGCDVKVFVPYGVFEEMKAEGIPVDEPFSITASEMSGIDWCTTLGIEPIEPMGILIERTIAKLKETGKPYDMQDMINAVNADTKSEKRERDAVANRFVAVREWGIFMKEGTHLEKFIIRGKATILDISRYSHMVGAFSIRAMVVGLVMKKLLEERIKARKIEELAQIEKGWTFFDVKYKEKVKTMVPIVWVFVDEIHEFLPLHGKTMATGPLVQVIREGRQPGVSLIVATQQPGKVHTDVLTQADLVISHRITAKLDIDALNEIMHTYLAFNITQYLNMLPNIKGCALALDDKQERLFDIQVRPKHSWHGGESPTAMPPKPRFETK